MPAYSYKCLNCGVKFELLHSTEELEDDVVCPECGSPKTVLVISPPSRGCRAGEFCSKSAGWKYT